jgi:MinD-like ATPase involved in chromosome partitioning or flagellar assembly
VNPAEPTVALVFSPERWVEELHRYLADHGGARVRQIVVEPSVALDEEYDTLVVSDRWPALTHGLVDALHQRSRGVLGVFDPDEPAGKDHLLGLGVDATMAADSPMDEFVAALAELGPRELASDARGRGARTAAGEPRTALDDASSSPGRLTVVGGPRGSGVTEVALALAAAVARRRESVVLVDAHETAPAVAGRLGLDLDPNLRSAVEAVVHGRETLERSITSGDPGNGFDVVSGFPSPTAASQVTPPEVLDVVTSLRSSYSQVIVDVAVDAGSTSPIGRALMGASATIVGVGSGSPVGVSRLLGWVVDVRSLNGAAPLHVVVNRVARDHFRRAEIESEIARTFVPASITFTRSDRHVDGAAWDGRTAVRGAFVGAVAPLANVALPSSRAHQGRARRWTRGTR